MKELKIKVTVSKEGKLAIIKRLAEDCIKDINEHKDGRRYRDYLITFSDELYRSIRIIDNRNNDYAPIGFIIGTSKIMDKHNCRGRKQAINAMKDIAVYAASYLA